MVTFVNDDTVRITKRIYQHINTIDSRKTKNSPHTSVCKNKNIFLYRQLTTIISHSCVPFHLLTINDPNITIGISQKVDYHVLTKQKIASGHISVIFCIHSFYCILKNKNNDFINIGMYNKF